MSGLVILFAAALMLLMALLTAMLVWEMTHPPRHTAGYAVARNMACSPDDAGLPFESWILDRPDGARLAVWEIRPLRGDGVEVPSAGGALDLSAVFIHGWGHSRIDMLARIAPYSLLCDRLILYDLRGHGDSEGSLCRLGHREDDDLLALLERIGDGRVILVGHSMGAVIAMRAVTKSHRAVRDRIAGMIAYGPYCEFHRSLVGRLATARLPTRPLTDLALLVLRAMGIRPLSINEPALQGWSVPLRVIHGDLDTVSPVAHAQRIVQVVGPHARLHVIAGAAHSDVQAVGGPQHDEIVHGFMDFLRAKR